MPIPRGYISAKAKRFIDAFCGQAGFNAVKAAKIAGYQHPGQDGPRLKRKHSEQLDKRMADLAAESQMSAREVLDQLTMIARSKDRKDLQPRLRALELLSKIHGLSSEKVSIKVDRQEVMSDLDTMLTQLVAISKKQAKPPQQPS